MKVLFFGTPDFAARHLRALASTPEVTVSLVITNPDRPAGRGGKLTPSPVKVAATELGIPVYQPISIKKDLPTFHDAIREFGPFDIGVVVAFGQILPLAALNTPKCGCINVHGSLLPRWRGAAPIQRSIMSGDKETGICLMQMDEGLDTGPVYISGSIPILQEDSTGSMYEKLAVLGTKLLSENIGKIASGELVRTPQPAEGVTYAHKITNDEARIDWLKSSIDIHNTIRGLSPVPGAFTSLNGLRLKIYNARVIDTTTTETPGKVLVSSGHDLRIACGSGLIGLLELQLEGKKKLNVEEFVKSGLSAPGAVLGL